MNKMDGLQAGVAEMRSVAHRLMEWADDLEASFQGHETPKAEVPAAGPGTAGKKKKTAGPAGAESAADEKAGKALTICEVRKILAGKCAAGLGARVRALIESYGVSSLREVPPEKYVELLLAVDALGGDADA